MVQVNLVKYNNRKIYNPADSQYVNLAQIQSWVESGTEVAVKDRASGADVTEQVLAEIVRGLSLGVTTLKTLILSVAKRKMAE